MLKLYVDTSFVLIIVVSLGAIFILVPTLLIQYSIHKNTLDPIYYNTDHFSAGELVILTTGFIFYIHKTLIYVRAITLPKTMRIRFKKDIMTFKDHPIIYLLAWFTMLLIVLGVLGMINFFIAMFFWNYYN